METKNTNEEALKELYSKNKNCNKCKLCKLGRKQIVKGRGNPNAKIMLVGEAPGAEEDLQGIPFVGRSGKLLGRILEKVGIDKKELYITNIVKCRPPHNRNPEPDEISICTKIFLYNEIKIIQPRIIVTLGSVATKTLLKKSIFITKIRGNFYPFINLKNEVENNIKILPTYHPAYLLRNPLAITASIRDFKKIIDTLK